MWIINEAVSNDFLELLLTPEYLHKSIFLVVIDFSKVGYLICNFIF